LSFQNDMTVKIRALLATASTSVTFYSPIAPETATFPYAVFKLDDSFTQNEIETYFLNIDLWDKNYDDTTINNVVDEIDDGINKTFYSTGGVGYQIDRVNILNLPAEGEYRGKELKYSVRVTRRII